MFSLILFIPFFLCWGSFLNVVAYRLIHNQSILYPRSKCTRCNYQLAWYDLIPVLSFIMLRGKCRSCKYPISYLYPLIELITAAVMTLLLSHYMTPTIHTYNAPYSAVSGIGQFLAYFIFFSALIVTIRSDLETMLISRFATLFLVPLGFLFSALHIIPLSLSASVAGALFGYGILYFISTAFHLITKKQGMGQGDLDLLAFIGSFTGISGAWLSLMIGSILGSIGGILYILIAKPKRQPQIPFGPFLAFGAIYFVLYQQTLIHLFLRNLY